MSPLPSKSAYIQLPIEESGRSDRVCLKNGQVDLLCERDLRLLFFPEEETKYISYPKKGSSVPPSGPYPGERCPVPLKSGRLMLFMGGWDINTKSAHVSRAGRAWQREGLRIKERKEINQEREKTQKACVTDG